MPPLACARLNTSVSRRPSREDSRSERPRRRSRFACGSGAPHGDERISRDRLSHLRAGAASGLRTLINLTFGLNGTFSGDPAALFAELVENPLGESAHVHSTEVICSASSSSCFSASKDRITARPMKGTSARRRTVARDAARPDGLGVSEKQQAENVMVVKMSRYDLGRIAEWGSVKW
jgi:para-aminobenzoate synthetase / 4-amino-4-deoxychorismate lyase